MTLQEFVNLHPNIVQIEKVGIEGIDLALLHEKIQKSRYLKGRQSFVYLIRNYKQIIAGTYDDFKLQEKEPSPSEKRRDLIRQKIMALKTVAPTLSENFNRLCREETGYTIQSFIDRLIDVRERPFYYDIRPDLKTYEHISALVGKYGHI